MSSSSCITDSNLQSVFFIGIKRCQLRCVLSFITDTSPFGNFVSSERENSCVSCCNSSVKDERKEDSLCEFKGCREKVLYERFYHFRLVVGMWLFKNMERFETYENFNSTIIQICNSSVLSHTRFLCIRILRVKRRLDGFIRARDMCGFYKTLGIPIVLPYLA